MSESEYTDSEARKGKTEEELFKVFRTTKKMVKSPEKDKKSEKKRQKKEEKERQEEEGIRDLCVEILKEIKLIKVSQEKMNEEMKELRAEMKMMNDKWKNKCKKLEEKVENWEIIVENMEREREREREKRRTNLVLTAMGERVLIKDLSHSSTLSKYLQFSANALNRKVEQAVHNNRKILCTLVMDGTSIRSQVDWAGKFTGFVNIENNVDYNPEDREELNHHWKIPIASFLINDISEIEKENFVKMC
ncbi:hypothetical protein FQR65_LT01625 [Abscondita terminalis]|nr:hypothetical protein FQR65_LT01625 [Abscondita terminalis]